MCVVGRRHSDVLYGFAEALHSTVRLTKNRGGAQMFTAIVMAIVLVLLAVRILLGTRDDDTPRGRGEDDERDSIT